MDQGMGRSLTVVLRSQLILASVSKKINILPNQSLILKLLVLKFENFPELKEEDDIAERFEEMKMS